MAKRAQVMIIALWILAILTILAVSIGHRVSMALRLSQYQSDRLKTISLAKLGVNRAIAEILNDDQGYDSLDDKWANNKEIFENISLSENKDEFATVSYAVEEDNRKETIFGMTDEEGKVNINTASPELLIALLEKCAITEVPDIVNNIRAWRGDTDAPVPDYQDLGYLNKSDKFSNVEELMLVKGITRDTYDSLKDLITVYGNGKINMNTASQEILAIVIDSCVKKLESEGNEERNPEDLVNRVMQLRQAHATFVSLSDLRIKLESQKNLSSAQNNILDKLQKEADTKSSCFYIISNGKINKSNLITGIRCIFDRVPKNIIYWHEG